MTSRGIQYGIHGHSKWLFCIVQGQFNFYLKNKPTIFRYGIQWKNNHSIWHPVALTYESSRGISATPDIQGHSIWHQLAFNLAMKPTLPGAFNMALKPWAFKNPLGPWKSRGIQYDIRRGICNPLEIDTWQPSATPWNPGQPCCNNLNRHLASILHSKWQPSCNALKPTLGSILQPLETDTTQPSCNPLKPTLAILQCLETDTWQTSCNPLKPTLGSHLQPLETDTWQPSCNLETDTWQPSCNPLKPTLRSHLATPWNRHLAAILQPLENRHLAAILQCHKMLATPWNRHLAAILQPLETDTWQPSCNPLKPTLPILQPLETDYLAAILQPLETDTWQPSCNPLKPTLGSHLATPWNRHLAAILQPLETDTWQPSCNPLKPTLRSHLATPWNRHLAAILQCLKFKPTFVIKSCKLEFFRISQTICNSQSRVSSICWSWCHWNHLSVLIQYIWCADLKTEFTFTCNVMHW